MIPGVLISRLNGWPYVKVEDYKLIAREIFGMESWLYICKINFLMRYKCLFMLMYIVF
jgi:hypothetical protein